MKTNHTRRWDQEYRKMIHGKTVESLTFLTGQNGGLGGYIIDDFIVIKFTDETQLKIYHDWSHDRYSVEVCSDKGIYSYYVGN